MEFADREVHIAILLSVGGELGSFVEMFGKGGTHAIAIEMKRNKALRSFVIQEPACTDEQTKNVLDGVRRTTPDFQLRPEREAADILEHHQGVSGDFVSMRRAPLHALEIGLLIAMQLKKTAKQSRAAP